MSAQIYGPELVVNGNFGSISTQGKNGDNSTGTHIYPGVSVSNIGTYYQPASSIYNESGNLLSLTLNTTATVGKPLASDQTSYTWGLSTNGPTKYYFLREIMEGKAPIRFLMGRAMGIILSLLRQEECMDLLPIVIWTGLKQYMINMKLIRIARLIIL